MLVYENHALAYRILRISDKWLIISSHVKFKGSCFPSSAKLPAKKYLKTQILDLFSNLPFHCSSTNENTSNGVDDCSLEGEEFYGALEEQPTQRIRVIGPRNPTLISGSVSTNNILPYRTREHWAIKSNVPKSYQEAARSDQRKEWRNSITQDLNNMTRLNVWTIRDDKDKDHPITSTWAFKAKKDDQQQITKYEARLCAQGFHQIQDLDYTQTFSPTGYISSL
ncbi:hypothetical protein O181_003595 [Austropuccinia psidii MF-1]|uniref:Reverse transcriptase Ty1/copia-type domain-containing protein n=1 Tax=Austropuccinia psidii MF-1 TaxID=1389203 RepID=A0A9Q3BER1_9BASI|nr:hypothetical protein [Austropuccinia psidii MF-1]